MNEVTKENLIKEIAGLVFRVNTETDNTVFLNIAGHTSQIDIDVIKGKWEEGADKDWQAKLYYDTKDDAGKYKDIADKLRSYL